jgi:hypothetical protein
MANATRRARRKEILEDHCIIFVDFLGFSNIVHDTSKTLEVLGILQALQSSRKNFRITKEFNDEHLGQLELQAAVSAFSDHVVISYPLKRMYVDKGLNEQTIPYLVMDHARALISNIAVAAFSIGLLIRGGMTIGKLYHHKGVVFGEGMIDAYRLESEVAIYPRVILSSAMSGNPAWLTEDKRMVKQDFDGVYFLDYIHPMIMSFSPGGIEWISGVKKRLDIVRVEIHENISKLIKSGRLKEAAKWGWLGNRLEESIRTLPQDGLSNHGVAREQFFRLGLKE